MIVFAASKQMNNNSCKKKASLNEKQIHIFNKLSYKSKEEIGKFLKIKNKTLDVTYDYYNNEEYITNKAINAYEGISYRQIDYRKNLKKMYIISALYGIVRSDQIIRNYRLDFTNKVFKDFNLYKYHEQYILDTINENNDKQLLNLCSAEYFKAINKNEINKQIIDLEITNEKINSVSLKKMRGQIANYCLENNTKNYEELDGFSNELFKIQYQKNILYITFKEQ